MRKEGEGRGEGENKKNEDRIDSDYHPVEVWIEGRVERRKRGERRERAGRVIWDGEGREMFRKKIELGRAVGEGVEEAGGNMELRIINALKETEKRKDN